MSWLSGLITAAVDVSRRLVPATAKIAIAGTAVTALQLETAAGSLSVFFSAMSAAIKAKRFDTGAEIAVEEAVMIAANLGLCEPMTGLASALLPYVFNELSKIASEPLVDTNGTWVTQQWAEDSRHQLNPDGSFKD